MILFKYILALLLTVPMGVLGIYLFVDYFDTVRGKKQARQAAEKRKLVAKCQREFLLRLRDRMALAKAHRLKILGLIL